MRRLSKKGWYLKDDKCLPPILHNFWKSSMIDYSKGARVLPSFFENSASARRIQFHWVYVGDSGAVVTPFMRVDNYSTRNFATLGPSELRPPFTGPEVQSFHINMGTFPLKFPALGRRQTLYASFDFAESCVFSKQSPPPCCAAFIK